MEDTQYEGRHPRLLEYQKLIVEHPSYAGMPDVIGVKGEIQWEAPSNRQTGVHRDTHHRRRTWWREKAKDVGVDPNSNEWISRTAKAIHPTGEKPCQVCGRVMSIQYAYPSGHLLNRLRKLPYVDDSFILDPLEHVTHLVSRMVEQFGDRVFDDLPHLFSTGPIVAPKLDPQLDVWVAWINQDYIPREPRMLSPGAMANPPDRLDGFHSYNRCCRATADRGRNKKNLQSYVTDRRVFEYWVDGDWVAANELMGIIRSNEEIKREPCLHGHPGPCSADHMGPISLGFAHRPEFQLLCTACNSGKNNRMYASDVAYLRQVDRDEPVTSWYSQELWDLRKSHVVDEETALRLSKLLRDNRHTAIHVLDRVRREGHYTFLATLLGLQYADYDVSFEGLRVEEHVTRIDAIRKEPRTTEQAVKQKARRLRVALKELGQYVGKESRNAFVVSTPEIEGRLAEAIGLMKKSPPFVGELDEEISRAFAEEVPSEEQLRSIATRVPGPGNRPGNFREAEARLKEVMDLVAAHLSRMWDDDRYRRTDY